MCREVSGASASIRANNVKSLHDRHRLRKARAALLGILLGLAICCGPGTAAFFPAGGAEAAEASAVAAPLQALQNACALAQRLTTAGKPAEALALIDRIRGPVPPQTQTPNRACEQERLNAIIAAQQAGPAAPAPTTPAQQAGNDWDRFVKNWATPWVPVGSAILGLVVLFLVLGRLLVFVPRMPFFKIGSGWRAGLLFGGLGLILLGSCGIVSGLGGASAGAGGASLARALWGIVVFEGGFVALAGAVALAFYLSSRLRVALDVRGADGKTNEADSTHIVALLHELGAAPPRGIEMPVGTDVKALDDTALAVAFSNKLLAAAQKILTSMFGVTPWRATVSPVGENLLAVAVTRNGWTVGAASIDRKALGLSGDPAGAPSPAGKGPATKAGTDARTELHKMAAAFILATLARKHHGFEGLCGATDWRSLGLHSIATTGQWADAGTAEALLGKAVDLDQGSMLADIALQYYRLRKEEGRKALAGYAEWLDAKASGIRLDIDAGVKSWAGYGALLYRVEMTFLSVVLNLPLLPEFDELRAKGRAVARGLLIELPPGRDVPVPGPLAHSMLLHAALAYHDLSAPGDAQFRESGLGYNPAIVPHFVDWYEEALGSVAPETAYAAACSIARESGLSQEEKEEKVIERLGYAFTDPGIKAWARSDPELQGLLGSSIKFREFMGLKPRDDYWKLDPFVPYEKQLRAAGVARPGDLTADATGPHDIRVDLQLSPFVFARLVRLASLVRRAEAVVYSAENSGVYRFRVEVVAAMVRAGIESPEEINEAWISDSAVPGHQPDFITKLRNSLLQRIMEAPEASALKAWLRALKNTPAGGSTAEPETTPAGR